MEERSAANAEERVTFNMRLEEYTADAICKAMGLPAFIEQPWASAANPVLRILLTPSFHPEVCITVTRSGSEAQLTVIALRKMLWTEDIWRVLPADRAQTQLPESAFSEVVHLFQQMRTAFDPNHRIVFCDGMGSESCLVSHSGVERLRTQVMKQFGIAALIGRVLELSWQSCAQTPVANAVAHAARYVGLEYPLQQPPVEPESIRVMVLGAEQERHDYLEMLRLRKQNRKPPSDG